MIKRILFLILPCAIVVLSCTTMKIQDVNYSYAVESVLKPDKNGYVEDIKHGIGFNVLALENEEFEGETSPTIQSIRLIRNQEGFYFITSDGFKHVYVMKPGNSSLILHEKIKVSENGLSEPAMNYRPPYIQLIEKGSDTIISLNNKGIQPKDKDRTS